MIYKGRKVLDGTLSSIQDKYASDTIRLRTRDGKVSLEHIDGVEKINDYGQFQELHMAEGVNSDHILRSVLEQTSVQSSEICLCIKQAKNLAFGNALWRPDYFLAGCHSLLFSKIS